MQLRNTWLYLPLLLATVASAGEPRVEDPVPLERFEDLSAENQAEVVAWFSADVVHLDRFQEGLRRYVLGLCEVDPGFLPDRGLPPIFSPEEHAPAQPIQRRFAKGSSAKRMHEKMFGRIPKRRGQSGWAYVYGERQVVRTAPQRDPERLFANALHGLPPDWDIVEALVEKALDDGSLQKAHAAFDHAYSDRAGRAYPDVTLYDAWSSGGAMEMPDVECLGIVHELLDDWRTWKAPVPAGKQDALYEKIAELYRPVHQFRALRRALARTYLTARPVLRDGYGGNEIALHALWDEHSSDPLQLIETLPPPEEWNEFWSRWRKRLRKEPKLYRKGEARMKALQNAADRIEGMAKRILSEFAPESAKTSRDE